MKNKNFKDLKKNAISISLFKIISLPLSLFVSILIARNIGVEEFGIYSILISIITFLILPIGTGMSQLLTRELVGLFEEGKLAIAKGLLIRSRIWILACSLAMSILFLISFLLINGIQKPSDYLIIGICISLIPFYGFNELRKGVLAGRKLITLSQIPELIIRPVTQLSVIALLIVYDIFSLTTALLALLISVIMSFLIGHFFVLKTKSSPFIDSITYDSKKWILELFPFIFVLALSTFNSQIGTLILGIINLPSEAAALRVAQSGGMLVLLPLTIVNLIIGPQITSAFRANKINELKTITRKSVRLSFLTSLLIILPIILYPSSIISWTFGNLYSEIAMMPLIIFSISQLIKVGYGSVGYILQMSGYENYTLKGLLLGSMVFIVFVPWLAYKYGASGVALANLISIFACDFYLSQKVRKIIGIKASIF